MGAALSRRRGAILKSTLLLNRAINRDIMSMTAGSGGKIQKRTRAHTCFKFLGFFYVKIYLQKTYENIDVESKEILHFKNSFSC